MDSRNNKVNKLKEVLQSQGRSQRWFADQMSKSENTVSLWTLNRVQPSLDDLYKAARLLGVEVKDLLADLSELDE